MKATDLCPQKGIGRFFWLFLWGPINLALAFLPLLFMNIVQIFSLAIWPFSPKKFRIANRAMAKAIWSWWVWGARELIGFRILMSGDSLPADENAIMIANHQSMADIIGLLAVAYDVNCLTRMTWIAKDVLKWVPGLGIGLMVIDAILLKRNWADDEESIRQTFARVTDNKLPIWLVSFPEGTRLKPHKLAASQEFASNKGLPVTKHVMVPRSKGFIASVKGLYDHIDAIYSCTIGYENNIPTLAQVIRGDVKQCHLHVKRIPKTELPRDDKDLTAWLVKDFERKEMLLDALHRDGKFPE